MPQRWLHNLFDIITHGKHLGGNWWRFHKEKDKPSQWLGVKHRILHHDGYVKIIKKLKAKGVFIEANNPYDLLVFFHKIPRDVRLEKTELIGFVHEVIDYVWSELPKEQRLGWAGVFRDVILNPTKYFKNGLLEPEDVDIPEFKKLREYVKSKTIDELI